MKIQVLEIYGLGRAVWKGGREVYEFGGDISKPYFEGSESERNIEELLKRSRVVEGQKKGVELKSRIQGFGPRV
jgi:hypothetical protein